MMSSTWPRHVSCEIRIEQARTLTSQDCCETNPPLSLLNVLKAHIKLVNAAAPSNCWLGQFEAIAFLDHTGAGMPLVCVLNLHRFVSAGIGISAYVLVVYLHI